MIVETKRARRWAREMASEGPVLRSLRNALSPFSPAEIVEAKGCILRAVEDLVRLREWSKVSHPIAARVYPALEGYSLQELTDGRTEVRSWFGQERRKAPTTKPKWSGGSRGGLHGRLK